MAFLSVHQGNRKKSFKMGTFTSCCIIDDDEFFAFNAKRLMKDMDFSQNILCYTNGQEAIDGIIGLMIENIPLPEVIFLDVNMPKKDGWEFLEEIKNIPQDQRRHTSIYITSSFVSPELMEKIKSFEMVHKYLVKPLTSKTLESIIASKTAC